jgi:hypothetical protein
MKLNNFFFLSPKPKRNRRKINYQRVLGFICVLLLGILIVVTYYLLKNKETKCQSNDVCTKRNCVLSGIIILDKKHFQKKHKSN